MTMRYSLLAISSAVLVLLNGLAVSQEDLSAQSVSDIDWTAVEIDRVDTKNFLVQLTPKIQENFQVILDEVRLPVLFPIAVSNIEIVALTGNAWSYGATYKLEGLTVSIVGTLLATEVLLDDATNDTTIYLANQDQNCASFEKSQEFGILDCSFEKYGASYLVTLDCSPTLDDIRCTKNQFVEALVENLKVIGGHPEIPEGFKQSLGSQVLISDSSNSDRDKNSKPYLDNLEASSFPSTTIRYSYILNVDPRGRIRVDSLQEVKQESSIVLIRGETEDQLSPYYYRDLPSEEQVRQFEQQLADEIKMESKVNEAAIRLMLNRKSVEELAALGKRTRWITAYANSPDGEISEQVASIEPIYVKPKEPFGIADFYQGIANLPPKMAVKEHALSLQRKLLRIVEVPVSESEISGLVALADGIGLPSLEQSVVIQELNRGNRKLAADAFLLWDTEVKEGKLVQSEKLRSIRLEERNIFLN